MFANRKKAQIKKNAAIMKQKFLARVNAHNRAYAANRKTGKLDPSRLAHYATSGNVFAKSMVQPGHVNHAVYILLDTSASMNRAGLETRVALATLATFLQSINVPFVVKGFGALKYSAKCAAAEARGTGDPYHHDFGVNTFIHTKSVDILKNVEDISFENGTPLTEALFYAHFDAKAFFEHTKAQEKHFVTITDGGCTSFGAYFGRHEFRVRDLFSMDRSLKHYSNYSQPKYLLKTHTSKGKRVVNVTRVGDLLNVFKDDYNVTSFFLGDPSAINRSGYEGQSIRDGFFVGNPNVKASRADRVFVVSDKESSTLACHKLVILNIKNNTAAKKTEVTKDSSDAAILKNFMTNRSDAMEQQFFLHIADALAKNNFAQA